MNGKLVVKTGLITAAVIAALAYFSYNASYNPDFSAIDFITAASPKKKAKNRKDVQETVYSIHDFVEAKMIFFARTKIKLKKSLKPPLMGLQKRAC